jgi:hypothetical protein
MRGDRVSLGLRRGGAGEKVVETVDYENDRCRRR